MSSPSLSNGRDAMLTRPNLPARSSLREPDAYAKAVIDALDKAINRHIWPAPTTTQIATTQQPQEQHVQPTGGGSWHNTLLQLLANDPLDLKKETEDKTKKLMLDQALAKDGKTSLSYEVGERLRSIRQVYNTRTLLARDSLRDYLFADAVYRLELTDPAAIATYMTDEDEAGGIRRLYETIVVEAVEDYIDKKKIEVDKRADFLKAIGPEIRAAKYSFQSGVFEASIRRPIHSYAFDRTALALIRKTSDQMKLGITPREESFLVHYFEESQLPLTEETRNHLIPIALTQRRNAAIPSLTSDTSEVGSLDFSVDYHEESRDSLAINQNNVLCAAQLFYVMTLGDELGFFPAADLLITKYLSAGVVDIQSPQLLQDLQNYALNDEFPDARTGRMYKRTSEEERRMFYRQVFNFGDSTLMDGMASNPDFEPIWNALMVEVVKFIEKVEQSEKPDLWVSPQYVIQAIEDLQYNLSTHASGMAKIMTPVMYKELDFIIERVFKSEEIIDQIALHNSKSYTKVVERILQEHYQRGINMTAEQNKAVFGHGILKTVAEYSPATMSDRNALFEFVNLVEAFIITGEQLENRGAGLFAPEAEEALPSTAAPDGGVDDWNF